MSLSERNTFYFSYVITSLTVVLFLSKCSNIFLGLVVCSQDDDLLGEILDEVAKKKTSDLSDKSEIKKKLDGRILSISLSIQNFPILN